MLSCLMATVSLVKCLCNGPKFFSVKSASISYLFEKEIFQMLLVALYGYERLKGSCIKFPIRPSKSCDSSREKSYMIYYQSRK